MDVVFLCSHDSRLLSEEGLISQIMSFVSSRGTARRPKQPSTKDASVKGTYLVIPKPFPPLDGPLDPHLIVQRIQKDVQAGVSELFARVLSLGFWVQPPGLGLERPGSHVCGFFGC